MLFHGTASHNFANIIRNGFCIPGGGGVHVVNGSRHGVGIYTSRTPRPEYVTNALSEHERPAIDQMLCCAGLLGGEFVTPAKQVNGEVVFFHEEQVLPCFLITFSRLEDLKDPTVSDITYHQQLVTELQILV